MTKRFAATILAVVLVVAIVAAAFAASSSKPVLTLQYQKASHAKCEGQGACKMGAKGKEGDKSCCEIGAKGKSADNCKGDMSGKGKCGDGDACGVSDKEVKRAFSALKHDLSAKGVKVKLQKVKGDGMPNTMSSSCGVWFSDVPMEMWVGSEMSEDGCKDMARGGCTEKIVLAGNKAAEHLLANGKIDPVDFSKPKGCGGCKDKAACGGKDEKKDVKE